MRARRSSTRCATLALGFLYRGCSFFADMAGSVSAARARVNNRFIVYQYFGSLAMPAFITLTVDLSDENTELSPCASCAGSPV